MQQPCRRQTPTGGRRIASRISQQIAHPDAILPPDLCLAGDGEGRRSDSYLFIYFWLVFCRAKEGEGGFYSVFGHLVVGIIIMFVHLFI